MFKKILFLFLSVSCIFTCVSCSGNTPTDEDKSAINPGFETNCRLFVKGVEITDSVFVRIDFEEWDSIVPIVAIVKALGGTAYKENETTTVLTLDGNSMSIDVSDKFFGNPPLPGAEWIYRKAVGDEIYLDACTASDILHSMGDLTVSTLFEQNIVFVGTPNYSNIRPKNN